MYSNEYLHEIDFQIMKIQNYTRCEHYSGSWIKIQNIELPEFIDAPDIGDSEAYSVWSFFLQKL